MIKKVIPFLVGIAILFGLFYLMTHPQNPTQSNSQKTVVVTPQVTESAPTTTDPYKDAPVYDNPDLVFFWGNGCPHCENVEDWLKKNNVDNKLKINYKEVYYNKDNQTDLYNTAKQYCPEIIENGGIGVPTGFDPSTKKCLQGDTPIIDFLSSKLGK